MDLIEAITIFVEVAEGERFSRAADKLGVSKSVVTRAIASLEERLNVRLSITEAGDIQGDITVTLVTADDRLLRGKGFRTLANR